MMPASKRASGSIINASSRTPTAAKAEVAVVGAMAALIPIRAQAGSVLTSIMPVTRSINTLRTSARARNRPASQGRREIVHPVGRRLSARIGSSLLLMRAGMGGAGSKSP